MYVLACCKGKAPAEVIAILEEEWARKSWDKDYESPMMLVDVQNGWHALECYPDDFFTSRKELLKRLSKDTEVVVCSVAESSNFSSACGYVDSVELWNLEHDFHAGREHLQTTGELPECFDRLAIEMAEKAKTVQHDCYFSFPSDICKELSSYVSNGDPRKTVYLPIPFLS
ncbi:hypothetical protein BH11CYA1_BH11CYA1_43980 [soil metagenome]